MIEGTILLHEKHNVFDGAKVEPAGATAAALLTVVGTDRGFTSAPAPRAKLPQETVASKG